jgi:hypothetical protein
MVLEKTLFIDETGKHSFSHQSPHFILSGCAIPTIHLEEIRQSANNIIFKYWGSQKSYLRKFKKRHITFHAKDIHNCKGPFLILKDPNLKRSFWNDVYGQLLSRSDITYFITLIDKDSIKKKYPTWPEAKTLDRSYEALLKSFIDYLIKNKLHGKICAESDSLQDKVLVSKLSYFQKNSHRIFKDPRLVNEKITSLSLVNKHDNNIGSQIADLMAWTGANKYIVENATKTLSNLRFEEKKLLKMFNGRLTSKHAGRKNSRFILIDK